MIALATPDQVYEGRLLPIFDRAGQTPGGAL